MLNPELHSGQHSDMDWINAEEGRTSGRTYITINKRIENKTERKGLR